MKPIASLAGLLLAALLAPIASAQNVTAQKGVISFHLPALADPILQHAKEVYVLYGCAYCHGVDLKVRNGEAADLLHSPLVGVDQDGNLIAPVLRSGIPQTPKLSPMPQFSDLSDGEIASIVRWIHYARQQERYKEIEPLLGASGGNATAGKAYFERECTACHSVTGDFAGIGAKYKRPQLAVGIARPAFVDAKAAGSAASPKQADARARHLKLLENYTAADVNNLAAYLETARKR
jgi:mono/diheme cytochrome c family protein